MSYIGSTPTTQSFIAGTDYFNGNGSTVNFTLSRSVNSVNDIEVIVNNVEQIPSGYSVSGTTLTFSAAPSAGTSNVYVRYLSTTNLSLAIPAGTSATFNTVTVADGSATTPSITNDGDTNTGIFFPAADTIAFAEGGVEAMRIDSDGDVGIGTSSPSDKLHVVATTNQGGIRVSGSVDNVALNLSNSGTSGKTWGIYSTNTNSGAGGGALAFFDGTAYRAIIDSSGNFLVGTTSTLGAKFALYGTQNGTNNNIQITNPGVGTGCLGIQGTSSNFKIYNCYSSGTLGTGAGIDIDTNGNVLVGKTAVGTSNTGFEFTPASGVARINLTSSGTGVQTKIAFYNNSGTYCGEIYTGSGTSTTYSNASDYRLKEDVQAMQGALSKVMALKPVTYKWKADGASGEGFIAHELQEVVPLAVSRHKDAVDADGNPEYQGIDQSKLVATLTAAIQEQQALITALTTRITALENNNATQ
jgi:hypothetical protein